MKFLVFKAALSRSLLQPFLLPPQKYLLITALKTIVTEEHALRRQGIRYRKNAVITINETLNFHEGIILRTSLFAHLQF